ncbi:hypothetical protein [Paraburkholderia sp.]|uniref:hypothetical protein n=1 Tax=Paraburkholderia sp. TaxID=1926495 RepID=UPI003D6FC467
MKVRASGLRRKTSDASLLRCDLRTFGRDAMESRVIARRPSPHESFDTGVVTPVRLPVRQVAEPAVKSHFLCRDGRALPLYGSMKDAAHGLYLGLFHGRDSVAASMDEMGAPGPAIGPLLYARTAYAAHLYLRFVDPATAGQFFPEFLAEAEDDPFMDVLDEIPVDLTGSTVPYDGRFFGDWTVFYHDASRDEPREGGTRR